MKALSRQSNPKIPGSEVHQLRGLGHPAKRVITTRDHNREPERHNRSAVKEMIACALEALLSQAHSSFFAAAWLRM
jgi:hypothetical protein